jgi:replicative DNA helicase
MITTREIALQYLAKGFSVIPLKSPSIVQKSTGFNKRVQTEYEKNLLLPQPRTEKDIYQELFNRECKLPLVAWKKYQNELPTEEEVNHWFNMNPNANIGIITGAVSGLVVFDLDSPEAVKYADEQGGFPDSVKVKTGKGYHVYMKHPGFEIRNSVNKKLDIDIRADGGYVAAPPSIHGSGHQYKWVEGYSISQIDPAPCSPWMTDYLNDISSSAPVNDLEKELEVIIKNDAEEIKTPLEAKSPDIKNPANTRRDYLDILKNGCVKGERNASAASFVGSLFKTGKQENEIWEIFQMWNAGKVKPPLGNDELKKIFDSIKTTEQKNKKEVKTINVNSFLYNEEKTIADYQKNYVRIPFGNTNLIKLENSMNGGFSGGGFYLFGGIPSSGKTVLLNNIADNICINGFPVLFFCYDDDRAELQHRTFARFSKQSIEEFNKRTANNLRQLWQLPDIKKIMSLKYVVQQMIHVEKWCDLIEQIKKIHGKAPVIIIDYLRKLRTEKSSGDERLRIDDILGKLTEIAKNNNTPVIAISELARDSYKAGQRLSMASFKESGGIEYEASWLGILGAVDEDGKLKENWDTIIEQDGNVDLIIFKAKRGTGSTGKVALKVDKETMTVRERIVDSTSDNPVTNNNKKKTKF